MVITQNYVSNKMALQYCGNTTNMLAHIKRHHLLICVEPTSVISPSMAKRCMQAILHETFKTNLSRIQQEAKLLLTIT